LPAANFRGGYPATFAWVAAARLTQGCTPTLRVLKPKTTQAMAAMNGMGSAPGACGLSKAEMAALDVEGKFVRIEIEAAMEPGTSTPLLNPTGPGRAGLPQHQSGDDLGAGPGLGLLGSARHSALVFGRPLAQRLYFLAPWRPHPLLKVMEKAKGAAGNSSNQYKKEVRSDNSIAPKTFDQLGISKQQSSDWQKLAD
jgi:hypothetical protein